MPCKSFPNCSPAISPARRLLVDTVQTKSLTGSPSNAESIITTGISFCMAAATGALSAVSSIGARTIPLTSSATNCSKIWICCAGSSSFREPFHIISTPASFAPSRAPASTALQNTCIVDLGITAIGFMGEEFKHDTAELRDCPYSCSPSFAIRETTSPTKFRSSSAKPNPKTRLFVARRTTTQPPAGISHSSARAWCCFRLGM